MRKVNLNLKRKEILEISKKYIVKDGWNEGLFESISKKNPLNHAELLVIKDACKIKNSRYLNDMIIFITLEPCAMCAAAISEARIKKLYFGAYDEKKGSIENNIRIFSNKNYFKPEIYGGIKEKECSLLLKNFFEQKRN